MNEFSKSQIMGWNNDGMDPDWRPDITELTSDPIEKLKELIRAVEPIIVVARQVPDESKAVDGKVTIQRWSVSASSTVWNRIVKAHDEVKFK